MNEYDLAWAAFGQYPELVELPGKTQEEERVECREWGERLRSYYPWIREKRVWMRTSDPNLQIVKLFGNKLVMGHPYTIMQLRERLAGKAPMGAPVGRVILEKKDLPFPFGVNHPYAVLGLLIGMATMLALSSALR